MSIHTVIAETSIAGIARRKMVWDVISNIELHSQKLANVLDVYSLKILGEEKHLSWNAMLDDAPFSWIEKNVADSKNLCVYFELLNGDFDVWKGKWTIGLREDGAVKIKIKLDYELGIPVLEENISDILQTKIHGYLKTMLSSLCKISENKQANERTNSRYSLINFTNASLAGSEASVLVLDISNSGAKIKVAAPLEGFNGTITIGDNKIEIGEVIPESSNLYRILFAHTLEVDRLSSLLDEAQFIQTNS